MRKVLGSVWLRAILCVALYAVYIIFFLRFITSGASQIIQGNASTPTIVLVTAFYICSCVAGWKCVRNLNTSAGAFMVVIKVLLAMGCGFVVLPFVIASIPYKVFAAPETGEAQAQE